MTDLDASGMGVLSFHCGAERFHELIENEAIVPTPYLAKAFWVTLERWDALRPREIEQELRRAHELIFEQLPKRTKTVLSLPESERKKIIRGRRKLVTARSGQTTAGKKAASASSRAPKARKGSRKK